MCCLHTLSSFRWVFLCVHVDVHTLELVCTVYVWTESSYAWFASCLFQSSRPILHLGRWEAFVKEALGVFLSRPVCFSDTQPGYLTCWWITQTVQSKFVFVRKRVLWRHLMYSSHDNLSVFHLFDSVCVYVCAVHPSNSSSSGRGEVRALSTAEQSNLSSVRVCGHNYTESSNFPHIPTACLDTAQLTSSIVLTASTSAN